MKALLLVFFHVFLFTVSVAQFVPECAYACKTRNGDLVDACCRKLGYNWGVCDDEVTAQCKVNYK